MVNGVMFEAVSVLGFAKMINKSRDTILRYERNGVIPPAPLLLGRFRYYPISLVRKLAPLMDKLPPNRKPDPQLLVEINKVFKEEKDKLCRKK